MSNLLKNIFGKKTKKCPICGYENPIDARFCLRDGTAFKKQVESYDAFISYRRDGGSHVARALQDKIETLGNKDLFLDVEELQTGRFDEKLIKIIRETPNFIIILSPESLDRCVEKNDWLKREIVEAIREEKNIIPVLVDNFLFPVKDFFDQLPTEMRELPNYHAVIYNHLDLISTSQKILRYMTLGYGSNFDTAKAEPKRNIVDNKRTDSSNEISNGSLNETIDERKNGSQSVPKSINRSGNPIDIDTPSKSIAALTRSDITNTGLDTSTDNQRNRVRIGNVQVEPYSSQGINQVSSSKRLMIGKVRVECD